MVITINGNRYTAVAGDVYLIEPGDAHALKNIERKNFVLHIFKWNENSSDIYWD